MDSVVFTTAASRKPTSPGYDTLVVSINPSRYTSDTTINIEHSILALAITKTDDSSDIYLEMFPFGSLLHNTSNFEEAYENIQKRLSMYVPSDMQLVINVLPSDDYREFHKWLSKTHGGSIIYG